MESKLRQSKESIMQVLQKTTEHIQNEEPFTAQLTEGLIISTGEARKILGATAKHLTDDELAKQILVLSDLAHDLLKYKHFAK